MAGPVHVDPAPFGDADGERIEALYQTHGVGVRMVGRKHREAPCRFLAVIGREKRRALAAQIGGKRPHAGCRGIARYEHQNGIERRHQRHRAVLKLGAAERLGVQVAGFLELERRFACDRERRPAADGDQAARLRDNACGRTPIEVERGRKAIGQPVDGCIELVVAGPRGGQPQQRGERSDKSFRRRNAELGSRRHRQSDVAGFRQRTVDIVDDGEGERACLLRHRRELGEVVAAPGLRNGQHELALEPHAFAIDRGDVRRGGSDGNAEIALDEVLAEGRRMGRASPRARDHDLGRIAPAPGGKLRDRLRQALLPPYRGGGFPQFRRHSGLAIGHQ